MGSPRDKGSSLVCLRWLWPRHHAPSPPKPQAARPDKLVTTGGGPAEHPAPRGSFCLAFPLLLPICAIIFYLLASHTKDNTAFLMGMTEKPVMTSWARVNKSQEKFKSNRWYAQRYRKVWSMEEWGKGKNTSKDCFWRSKAPDRRRQGLRSGG